MSVHRSSPGDPADAARTSCAFPGRATNQEDESTRRARTPFALTGPAPAALPVAPATAQAVPPAPGQLQIRSTAPLPAGHHVVAHSPEALPGRPDVHGVPSSPGHRRPQPATARSSPR